jgi:hypothetical protein
MAVLAVVRGVGRVIGFSVKWTLLLFALLVVIAIVVGVVKLAQSGEKSTKRAAAEKITPALYRRIAVGMTPAQVRRLAGRPRETSTSTIAGLGKSDCWYYGSIFESKSYELCFSNGRLGLKSMQ